MKKILFVVIVLFMMMPVALHAQFSPAPRNYVEFLLTASHANSVYSTGEIPHVTLRALAGGEPLENVSVRYESGMDLMPADFDRTVTISGGECTMAVPACDKPGFRYVRVTFNVGGKDYKSMIKLAFSPDGIEPTVAMPADFETFWAAALREASMVDLDPQVTRLEKYCTDKVDVSLVKLTVGPHGRSMFGYLTVPKDGKKHPVLFCPPGAGANRISPTTFYSERGYIYFNICIHDGLNPELPDAEFNEARKVADDYTFNGIQSPETFYYRSVYAGCSRCVDFLCTLPGWDGKNVGVTGGSQGGALTVITAALNPKVTFAASFYPALCDLPGFVAGRAGGWPKYFMTDPAGSHETELKTLQYYDVVNFGRLVKCPLLLSYGYADDTCSPTSVTALRNVVTAPLTVIVTPNSAHWRYMESNDKTMEWQKALLK